MVNLAFAGSLSETGNALKVLPEPTEHPIPKPPLSPAAPLVLHAKVPLNTESDFSM